MRFRTNKHLQIIWLVIGVLACLWCSPETVAAGDPFAASAWTQVAKLMASDPGDWEALGISIAVEGDTVVVGAWRDNGYTGAAYVYVKPAGGWTDMIEVAKLTSSDGEFGHSFGTSVAICGDTIVVGTPERYSDHYGEGAAYVFEKPVGGWSSMTESAVLLSSDIDGSDYLGWSVSIDGGTVAVGAYGEGDGAGAAYVFERPGGGWSGVVNEVAKLTASDGARPDYLGISISVSGDTVVSGAFGDHAGQGSAYVFVKPGGWVDMYETARLTASDAVDGAALGKSVSIAGDTIAVGSHQADSYAGAVYIYEKPVGGWANMTEQAKLTASDSDPGDHMGISVCLDGDGGTVVAGADYDGENGPQAGAVYVFDIPAGGWADMTETDKLITSDGVTLDYFGYAAAVDGNTIVGGAWGDDDGGFQGGAAYVFERPSDDPLPDIKANGSDGPLTVTQGTNVSVEVFLDPGNQDGSSADWWVVADSASGWYRYDVGSGSWVPGLAPTYQGTLRSIGPVTVFDGTHLPVGSFTFYFGVDMNMNGVPDLPEMYLDSVDVTVQ